MAVENFKAAQLATGYRRYPIDDHGKLRFVYFKVTSDVAGDANTTAELGYMPPGRLRILPALCRIATEAFGSSRTLDIGHGAYQSAPGTTTDADEDAFVAALDVSSAVALSAWSAVAKFDIYSLYGWTLTAKCEGGTWPITKYIEGYCAYLYE